MRNREEVVNTQLAVLISKLGVVADAETIHLHGTHRPDVLFRLRGLRVVIEGKFADVSNAEQVVLGDARNRSFRVHAFFSRRVTTEGAFIQMKKPAWEAMPVLDARRLSAAQTMALADTDDDVASKSLAPLAQLNADPVRHEIDDTVCAALRLPSLAPVRALLAREPGLTGRRIG